MSSRRTPQNTNVNLLVALDALLQTRSVTRAAEAVGISQSAMSNALAQLRDLLQDPLLVRAGKAMEPTPFATGLVPDLRAGVGALERVLDSRGGFDPPTSRANFTLALGDRDEAALLPPLLSALRERAPGVSIQVLPWGRLEPHPGLGRGEVDVSLGPVVTHTPQGDWPAAPDQPRRGFHTRPLYDSMLRTVVRADHPEVVDGMDLDTFCRLDHVLVTEQPEGTGIIDDALRSLGRARTIAVRVPRHTLVGELIASTDLVATIDGRVARAQAQMRGLQVFPVPVEIPRATVAMVWHDRTDADPARAWLRATIAEVASAL